MCSMSKLGDTKREKMGFPGVYSAAAEAIIKGIKCSVRGCAFWKKGKDSHSLIRSLRSRGESSGSQNTSCTQLWNSDAQGKISSVSWPIFSKVCVINPDPITRMPSLPKSDKASPISWCSATFRLFFRDSCSTETK